MLTIEEATAAIADKADAARQLLREAEEIAKTHGLYVHFELTYGAGAQFNPHAGEWVSSSAEC